MKNLLQTRFQGFKEKLDNVIYPDNEVGVLLLVFSLIKVATQYKVGDVAGAGKDLTLSDVLPAQWPRSRPRIVGQRRQSSGVFVSRRLQFRPRSPGLGLIHFNWSAIRFYFLSNSICPAR